MISRLTDFFKQELYPGELGRKATLQRPENWDVPLSPGRSYRRTCVSCQRQLLWVNHNIRQTFLIFRSYFNIHKQKDNSGFHRCPMKGIGWQLNVSWAFIEFCIARYCSSFWVWASRSSTIPSCGPAFLAPLRRCFVTLSLHFKAHELKKDKRGSFPINTPLQTKSDDHLSDKRPKIRDTQKLIIDLKDY